MYRNETPTQLNTTAAVSCTVPFYLIFLSPPYHQSLISPLPDKAWQMTMALSALGESLPTGLYAKGIFW